MLAVGLAHPVQHQLVAGGKVQREPVPSGLVRRQRLAAPLAVEPRLPCDVGRLVVDDEASIRDLLSKTLALAEYDVGELEGKSDAASWQQYYAVQNAWFRDRDFSARISGGESFEDVRARFVPFIDALLASPPAGPVLLLGHGGTFRCMLPLILSNITFEYIVEHHMANADVVVAEQRSNELVCVRWGPRRTF